MTIHACAELPPLRVEIPKFAFCEVPDIITPIKFNVDWFRVSDFFLFSKIGVSHWQRETPLQQFCTTVQTMIIWIRRATWPSMMRKLA